MEEQFVELVVNQYRQQLADTQFALIKANARIAILESVAQKDEPATTEGGE